MGFYGCKGTYELQMEGMSTGTLEGIVFSVGVLMAGQLEGMPSHEQPVTETDLVVAQGHVFLSVLDPQSRKK